MTDVLSPRFHSDAPLVDELRTALSESAPALVDILITEDVAKKVVDALARLDHEQLAGASEALHECEGVVRAAPGCERLAWWLEFLIGRLAAGQAPDGCGIALAILFLALQRQTDFTIPRLGDFIVETFEPALPALSESELGSLLSAVFATDPGPSVMLQLVRAARTALRANRPESSLATQLALHEFWALSELGPPDLKRIVKYPALKSYSETTVAEKSETEGSVAADAVQTVFGDFGHLSDCVHAEVGEFFGFHTPPDLLGGIDVRSVAGESLDAQPVALACNPVQHATAAV